jgi:hypothetical protein
MITGALSFLPLNVTHPAVLCHLPPSVIARCNSRLPSW